MSYSTKSILERTVEMRITRLSWDRCHEMRSGTTHDSLVLGTLPRSQPLLQDVAASIAFEFVGIGHCKEISHP